jgi:hypothetical protein
VVRVALREGAELLVVFDNGGVTGGDHEQATRAAFATAADIDVGVLAWARREPVAATLRIPLGHSRHGAVAASSIGPGSSRRE